MTGGRGAVEAGRSQSAAVFRLGGATALLVATMLLVGSVGPVLSLPGLGIRNWLVVLFQINARTGLLPSDPLRVFNIVDVVVLCLVGTTFICLWATLVEANRIAMGIAAALPFVGVAVLVATNLAGRSSVMAAGILACLAMLPVRRLKPVAYLGIAANALLLLADFTTTGSRNLLVAVAIGVGYALLIAWFVAVGVQLLWPGGLRPTASASRHT